MEPFAQANAENQPSFESYPYSPQTAKLRAIQFLTPIEGTHAPIIRNINLYNPKRLRQDSRGRSCVQGRNRTSCFSSNVRLQLWILSGKGVSLNGFHHTFGRFSLIGVSYAATSLKFPKTSEKLRKPTPPQTEVKSGIYGGTKPFRRTPIWRRPR